MLESGLRRALIARCGARDLYGPRHLLRQGVLPADLIYRHRGYLQELVGAEGMEQALAFYGADVVRRGMVPLPCLGTEPRRQREWGSPWKRALSPRAFFRI